jgi:hypothetical protein
MMASLVPTPAATGMALMLWLLQGRHALEMA